MRKFAVQRREPFFQRNRLVCEIHENEAFPKPEVHRRQRVIGLVESRHLIHVRRTDQPAIQRVSPGMIRALNCRRMATRFLFQSAATVAADIVKSSDLLLLISDYDQTLVSDCCYEKVARIRNLTLMPDQ